MIWNAGRASISGSPVGHEVTSSRSDAAPLAMEHSDGKTDSAERESRQVPKTAVVYEPGQQSTSHGATVA